MVLLDIVYLSMNRDITYRSITPRLTEDTATSWACIGFSLKEERVMQHSSSKYFPQFENQGINLVGVSRQVSKVPAQKQANLHPTLQRGCQSLHDWLQGEIWRRKVQQSKSVGLKIWCEVDPGAIVFTRGFSQDSKYYGGWTNYCRAIDRTAQSHDDI